MEETNELSFRLSRISTAPSIGHLHLSSQWSQWWWCDVLWLTWASLAVVSTVVKCGLKKQCFKKNRPSPAADAFSSTLDKEEIPSSSPLLDPCSPWSFVPIVSSPKPSGARSFPLSVLSWEEQRNDLMIYSVSGNCNRSVANWISVWPT